MSSVDVVSIAMRHMSIHRTAGLGGIVWVVLATAQVCGQAVQRFPAPDWQREPGASVFFDDVFREALVGNRPRELMPDSGSDRPEGQRHPSAAEGVTTSQWSSTIAADVLMDEIKSCVNQLARDVQNTGDFSARGQREARDRLILLTVMFHVVSQYDGEIRWQAQASSTRDTCAATVNRLEDAPNSSTARQLIMATQQSLQEVLAGGPAQQPLKDTPAWYDSVDRAALMRRLEAAVDSLDNSASSNKELQARQWCHELGIIATLAEFLTLDGMDDADDPTYRQFASQMHDLANGMREHVQQNLAADLTTSRKSLQTTCANCHNDYR